MSIDKLIENTASDNLAEGADPERLMLLGRQVVDIFSRDIDSMSEWSQSISDGIDIARQECNARSEPWEGASNFKSPEMLKAAIAFGDRAETEILRGRNIAKYDVIGADPNKTKRNAGERVIEFLNWQLNYDMTMWRDDQSKLFYEVAAYGTVYKKTYYCPIQGKNKSDVIHYPDFAVNQAGGDVFTQILDYSAQEVLEKQAAGIWLDEQVYNAEADADQGSNQEQGVESAADNSMAFLEQECFFDLDGDGMVEPYTVTVHQQTQKVMRIVARYGYNDIIIKDMAGAVRRLEPGESTSGMRLVRIDGTSNITKYGFIPNPDGTYLDIGYFYLLGAMSKAINSTTNQLMDAGQLANLQGGFLARGFRKKMGQLRTKPGSWISTDISAQELQTGVMPHAFKEPSPTLFALKQDLETKVKELAVAVDFKGVIGANAPATTTLALIQEAMLPTSAIMGRIIRCMGKELQKLYKLNAIYADPETYKEVVDDDAADYASDFSLISLDIVPTANPEMSSRMQRLAQAEAMMLQAQNIALAGGDSKPIFDNYFAAIGADDMIDAVFPADEEMTAEQQARIQAQQAQQRMQMQLLTIQIDHAERDANRRDAETRANLAEAAAKIRESEADIILKLEKAESEQVKNQISIYTAQIQATRAAIENTLREMEHENAERLSGQSEPGERGEPGEPGEVPRMAAQPINGAAV